MKIDKAEFMECSICEAPYRERAKPGQTWTRHKPYYKTYLTLHEPDCPLRFRPAGEGDDDE